MEHEYFGKLELDDGWVELERQLGNRTVNITLESSDGLLRDAEVEALAQACQGVDVLVERARAQIRAEYQELFGDAFSVWIEDDPQLLAHLDPRASKLEDVSAEAYEARLVLEEIRLHSSTDDEPGSIVFDFAFDLPNPVSYVVGAYFGFDLALSYVALES